MTPSPHFCEKGFPSLASIRARSFAAAWLGNVWITEPGTTTSPWSSAPDIRCACRGPLRRKTTSDDCHPTVSRSSRAVSCPSPSPVGGVDLPPQVQAVAATSAS